MSLLSTSWFVLHYANKHLCLFQFIQAGSHMWHQQKQKHWHHMLVQCFTNQHNSCSQSEHDWIHFWTELNFLHSLLVHACTSAHACTYMLVLICLCLYLYLYLYVCTCSLCVLVLVLVLVLICLCLCLHLYLFFVCACACTCACAGTYMLVLVLVLVLCVCLYLCLCLHLYLCLHHTCGSAHQQLSSQHNPKM